MILSIALEMMIAVKAKRLKYDIGGSYEDHYHPPALGSPDCQWFEKHREPHLADLLPRTSFNPRVAQS
jgi:hypothetical protein